MFVKNIAELLHLGYVCCMQIDIRDGMEADEVYLAVQAGEQLDECVGMTCIVVQPTEHDVFECEMTLVAEVILAQKVEYVLDMEVAFDRHQSGTFLRERTVYADGKMALALFEVFLEVLHLTDGRDGNAFRTPCHAPRRRDDLKCLEYCCRVVERFAHAHEDDIGERKTLRDSEDLIEDLGCREVSVESLFAGLAEVAVHLATHLA